MTLILKNIELEKGLDSIRFGMSRDEITELLGKPDEVEELQDEYDDNDEIETIVFHYDEYELSFAFEADADFALTGIGGGSNELLFEGVALIGKEKSEVMEILEQKGLSNLNYEDTSTPETPNSSLLYHDDKNLNLWFDDKKLIEIQWGAVE